MKTQVDQETSLRGSSAPYSTSSRLVPLWKFGPHLTLLLLLFSGAAAQAATPTFAGRLSVSAEAGVVHRKLNGPLLRSQPQVFPGSPAVFRDGSSETKGYGAAYIGLKLTELFSLRAGYQDFGSTSVLLQPPPHVVFIQPPPTDFRFRDRAFTLDPVLSWKVGSRLTLHAFWGVAFNRSDVTIENYRPTTVIFPTQTKSSKTTQSRLGAGMDVQLTPQLSLRGGVDYQRFSSFTKEGWLGHAGLVFTF
jgi:hypothetical protein